MLEKRQQFPYEDIIDLPRPISARRAKMSALDRAAQFSPFSALSGYDDAITETARLTEGQIELTEGEKSRLNAQLQVISENNTSEDTVMIRYFECDLHKSGGTYVTVSGSVKKVDPYERTVIMSDGRYIPMDNIYSIESSLFRDADNDFCIW